MKKLIFIIFMLIGWMSGSALDKGKHYELGFNYKCFDAIDILGQSPLIYNGVIRLNDEAISLCSKFNEPVTVVSIIDYPLSMFYNENTNIEAAFQNSIAKAKFNVSNSENLLILIALKSPTSGKFYVKVVSEIRQSAFPSACQNNYLTFADALTQKYNEVNGLSGSADLHDPQVDVLKEANALLNSGCENMSNNYFNSEDFLEYNLDPSASFKRSPNGINSSGLITNFGNILMDNVSLNQTLSSYTIDGEYGFNYSYIISSKKDAGRINEIINAFNSSSAGIVMWIHFDFDIEDLDAIRGDEDSGTRSGNTGTVKIRTKNNLGQAKIDAICDKEYDKRRKATGANCSFPQKDFGTNCIIPNGTAWFGNAPLDQFNVGVAAGLMDSLMETAYLMWDSGKSWYDTLKGYGAAVAFAFHPATSAIAFHYAIRNYEAIKTVIKDNAKAFVKTMADIKEVVGVMMDTLNSVNLDTIKSLVVAGYEAIYDMIKTIIEGENLGLTLGLLVGAIAFEVLTGVLSGGAATAAKTAIKGSKVGKSFVSFIKTFKDPPAFKEGIKRNVGGEKFTQRAFLCVKGCFLAGTPVFAAANGHITPIAIENISLFTPVVAHTQVNATYGMTASADNVYNLTKDPYTSDQQRERDEYVVAEHTWNEVILKQVIHSEKPELNNVVNPSMCKLALTDDWIHKHNYTIGGIVHLDLPEQGISGPFRITSIKHILPQKIPTEENNLLENYTIRPVTGIFAHHSTEVWSVKFENGDSLGVTFNHPIYTTTGWKAAGTLLTTDVVLTYTGYTKVNEVIRNPGSHLVYNLEVKDLHNFLVGDAGVVVHNGYLITDCLNEIIKDLTKDSKLIDKTSSGKKAIGKYGSGGSNTGGHHFPAKSAFKDDPDYNENNAWSISQDALNENTSRSYNNSIHQECINAEQGKRYREWYNSNSAGGVLQRYLTLADIIEIEIGTLIHCGIPSNIARGWALEILQNFAGKKVTNIPYVNKLNKI